MTDSSFDKIKKMIKIIGGKVIVVEDGKPTMVIIDIDEYTRFNDIKNEHEKRKASEENFEKINSDINTWKKKQEEKRLRQLESNLYLCKKRSVAWERNNDDLGDGIVVEGL